VIIKDDPVIFTDENGKQHDIMLLKLPSPTTITPVAIPDCVKPDRPPV